MVQPALIARSKKRRHARGFTLIELGVVMFIVVLLMGIAIPAISTVTGLRGRQEMGKLMANIRATRGHAAVAGETCRMAFEIESASYTVECTKGSVGIQAETMRSGQMEIQKPKDLLKSEKDMTPAEKLKKKIMERVKFASLPTLASQKMSGGVVMESVWTGHQEDKYLKGKAYLYFFPSGTSEMADIVLRQGDDYFTIQVSPMAGKVALLSKKVDKSKDDGSDFF